MTKKQILTLINDYNRESLTAYVAHTSGNAELYEQAKRMTGRLNWLITEFGIEKKVVRKVFNKNGYLYSRFELK